MPTDLQVMGRRERIQEVVTVRHFYLERGFNRLRNRSAFRRIDARAPHGPPYRASIDELKGITCALQHLRVSERHLPLLTGLDREDTCVSGQLDEGRVGPATDDVFIDAPRLVCVHDLAAEFCVALKEGKALEDSLTRERV